MEITTYNKGNKIQVSLPIKSSMENLKEWKVLITNILLLAKGQKTSLITVSPQSYSIGEEIGNFQKLKRGKRDYLINWDITLTEDVLHLIIESEEFERGLLFLVSSENIKDIFDSIDALDSVSSIDFSKLEVRIIVLEDDRKTLSLNYPTKEMRVAINGLIESSRRK